MGSRPSFASRAYVSPSGIGLHVKKPCPRSRTSSITAMPIMYSQKRAGCRITRYTMPNPRRLSSCQQEPWASSASHAHRRRPYHRMHHKMHIVCKGVKESQGRAMENMENRYRMNLRQNGYREICDPCARRQTIVF